MAKDFTKYKIEGIADNLNKARLVQKVVSHYCENENPNFDNVISTWFDELQGGKGVVRLLSDVDEKNSRNYYMDAPIKLKDGSLIVVCNQWGKDNLANFIYMAGFHGYKIIAEVENEISDNQVDAHSESNVVVKDLATSATANIQIVTGSPNWQIPEAIAFIVRHMIISDNEILEGELNWMQVAFEEFEKENIDVRSAWDMVDDQAQLYSQMGFYDNMFSNVIVFLNDYLSAKQKSTLIAILMEISAEDGIIKQSEYVTLMVIAGLFYPGKEKSMVLEPFMKAGINIEGVKGENSDSYNLPENIKENLSQEENIDENIFFIYNYVKEAKLSNDELEGLYLKIIDFKPNAQIAGQYAQELFRKGKIEIAKTIIENRNQYNGNDFAWEVFEDAVNEINKNLNVSKFEEFQSNNDEDLTLTIEIFGNLHNFFQCRKDEDQDINEIENHYENTLSNFFKIDSDNSIIIKLNDKRIFEGPVLELGIIETELESIEDTDRSTLDLIDSNLTKIKKINRFTNMDSNEFLVSKRNNFIVINNTSGALGYYSGKKFAPEFDNRYTMVEYGKYHIQTIPVKLKKFKLSDLFFQKDTGMEDIIGTSADGVYYCFSLIFHNELGELEFEIQNNNIKSTEFYGGWMDEA